MCDRSPVLVTGASGLIGSHVVDALQEAGYAPRGFARTRPSRVDCEWVTGDIRDAAALRAAAQGCAAIIHTAAVYSYVRACADEIAATNVEGTRNVLAAAADARVGRVVVTSSAGTCGPVVGRRADEHDLPPEWELDVPYKRSKLAAERLALDAAATGLDVVVVNPTTTIGGEDRRPTPSGRIVRDVLWRRIHGYLIGGGLNVVAAADVARGHVLALERGHSGQRYLLGGDDVPMKSLFEQIAALGGVPAPRVAIPYGVALASAWVVDVAGRATGHESTLMTLDEVRLSRVPMYFSVDKARRELGYTYQPVAEALSEAVSWFARLEPPRRLPTGRLAARHARAA